MVRLAAADAPTVSAPRLKGPQTALLLIDLITDFKFEDGKRIAAATLPAAHRIARLRQRARQGGLPNIFVNDNQQHWKWDFKDMVAHYGRNGSLGAPVVKLLRPTAEDYFVLKPTHAGFYGTTLERLLHELHVKTLIMTGISAHQCVLFTANEAYLREFELIIPRDCIAAKTLQQRGMALRYFKSVLHADVRSSAHLMFSRAAAGASRRGRADM
jgi:nicotinamidase-related amidase